MNAVAEIRKRVVQNGKMKYGAQSRLAQLLGVHQSTVRRIFLGNRFVSPEHSAILEKAIKSKAELFTVRSEQKRCNEPRCKCASYAKGKCRAHYYAQWRAGILGAVSL